MIFHFSAFENALTCISIAFLCNGEIALLPYCLIALLKCFLTEASAYARATADKTVDRRNDQSLSEMLYFPWILDIPCWILNILFLLMDSKP
jgi:hypothetical protein